MVRSRLGLKVLGLCALALGLMAFVASAAQAEENAHWNIVKANGELIQVNETNKLFAQLEIKEIENNTATLLFTTKAGTKVGILCTAAKFDAGGQLQAHGTLSLGQILFTKCTTSLNGVVSPPCKPSSPGTAAGSGEILTEKATGLISLGKLESGEVDDLVKLTPDEKETFAKIKMGAECAIGELVPVTGTLWIKDCGTEPNKSFLEEKVEHLIEEAGIHGLLALGQPATIDGSALVRLSGAEHLGLKWGGTPG